VAQIIGWTIGEGKGSFQDAGGKGHCRSGTVEETDRRTHRGTSESLKISYKCIGKINRCTCRSCTGGG